MAVESVRLVPAIDRAARALALLAAEGRPLGISDVARHLNASKGTVRDILETLRCHGLLDRDGSSKRYQLGPGLARLGSAALDRLDLSRVARPYLRGLAEQTGETVLLFVRHGERAVILEQAEAPQPAMRVTAQPGRRIPLLAGACGKVFVAYEDDAARAAHLARLPRFTERTIVDPLLFRAELESVRRMGYALDDQEYLDGVRAAAAPIHDGRARLAAVLLGVGLAGSVTVERLVPLAEATRHVARQIAAALGAPSPAAEGGTA